MSFSSALRVRWSLLLVALLSLALAAVAQARPSDSLLTITTDKPIAVLVDGQILDFVEGTTRVEMYGVSPGRHMVEFRNLFGKLIDEGVVEVPDGPGAIVRARYAHGEFDVYETIVADPGPPPAPYGGDVVVVQDGAAGGVVVDGGSTETVSVSVGGGLGMMGGVGASATVTTTTTSQGGGDVVYVEESQGGDIYQEAAPAERRVTLRSTDEEWGNVFIDGKRVWEIRAMDTEKSIILTTGEHTIEVKDFMENETWCKGRLIVDGYTDLIIGVTKGRDVEVFNDSNAFRRF